MTSNRAVKNLFFVLIFCSEKFPLFCQKAHIWQIFANSLIWIDEFMQWQNFLLFHYFKFKEDCGVINGTPKQLNYSYMALKYLETVKRFLRGRQISGRYFWNR